MDVQRVENHPVLEKNGLPPAVYYKLDEAAALLETTTERLIHYGATSRIELITPIPNGISAKIVQRDTGNRCFQFCDPVFISLSCSCCRSIEFFGEAKICSFSKGYDVSDDSFEECFAYDDPLSDPFDDSGIKVFDINEARRWEYVLHQDNNRIDGVRITAGVLCVLGSEIESFKRVKGGNSLKSNDLSCQVSPVYKHS